MSTAIVTREQASAISLSTAEGFAHAQRVAQIYASSQLVPVAFQKNLPNVVIAMEMASRIGASPLAVMQSMDIIHGRPSWRAQFIIAAVNSCGRFTPLRYDVTGKGDSLACVAWAFESDVKVPDNIRTLDAARQANLPVLESAPVSIQMAKDEGWYSKTGSKWKTMPELMIRYRAATFFGRMYAPDILMGMQSDDEAIDISKLPAAESISPTTTTEVQAIEEKLTRTRKPRGGAAAAAADIIAETTLVTEEKKDTAPAEEKADPTPAAAATEKPTETPAEPASNLESHGGHPDPRTEPAAEEQSMDLPAEAPANETKRCEIKSITPKKSNAGPALEVVLSGDFDGKAYFRGEAKDFPGSAGVVADVTLEKKMNGNTPFFFITDVKVLA